MKTLLKRNLNAVICSLVIMGFSSTVCAIGVTVVRIDKSRYTLTSSVPATVTSPSGNDTFYEWDRNLSGTSFKIDITDHKLGNAGGPIVCTVTVTGGSDTVAFSQPGCNYPQFVKAVDKVYSKWDIFRASPLYTQLTVVAVAK